MRLSPSNGLTNGHTLLKQTVSDWILTFFRDVKYVPLEGSVSQIFYLGLSFYVI